MVGVLEDAELGSLAGHVQSDEGCEQHRRHPPCVPAHRVRRGRSVGALQQVGSRGRGQLLREERQRSARQQLNLDALEALACRLHQGGMTLPLRRAGVEDEAAAAWCARLDAGERDLECLGQGVGGQRHHVSRRGAHNHRVLLEQGHGLTGVLRQQLAVGIQRLGLEAAGSEEGESTRP